MSRLVSSEHGRQLSGGRSRGKELALKHSCLILAGLLIAAVVAVAPAAGVPSQTPKRGGTVVGGNPAGTEPACFNLLVDCRINPAFVRQVLEGAFEVGPDLSYRPNLVSHVTLTKKPFTLTYHIRPEARWSDDIPVTARDFVFTWQTYSKLELSDFPPTIRQVRALDTKTVRVDFRSRFAGWRDLFGVVLPRHALAGEDPRTIWRDGIENPKTGDPIGSGPFLVGSVERGRQFTLVRNRRYWGPHQAYLDRLVFRFLAPPFPESGLEAMRGGTVDALFDTSHEPELTAFCRERGVDCRTAHSTRWEHIVFRLGPGGHDALKQRSVRQAIAYGIDRNALVRQLYPDLPSLQPLQNFIFLPGQRFYEPHWKAYAYQPAKARRLLEGAGCRRGADGIYICSGERLSLRFVTTPGVPVRARTIELVQAELRQAGVEVRPIFVARRALFDQVLPNGDYDLALFQFFTNPDPGASADIWRCNGPANFTGYCSRLVTQEFVQSQLIVDAAERAGALNRADRQMAKAVPALPLYQDPSTTVIKGIRLRGLISNGTLEGVLWNAEDWWRER
jgi:peptide/nickel transport system substrate-binding protein